MRSSILIFETGTKRRLSHSSRNLNKGIHSPLKSHSHSSSWNSSTFSYKADSYIDTVYDHEETMKRRQRTAMRANHGEYLSEGASIANGCS